MICFKKNLCKKFLFREGCEQILSTYSSSSVRPLLENMETLIRKDLDELRQEVLESATDSGFGRSLVELFVRTGISSEAVERLMDQKPLLSEIVEIKDQSQPPAGVHIQLGPLYESMYLVATPRLNELIGREPDIRNFMRELSEQMSLMNAFIAGGDFNLFGDHGPADQAPLFSNQSEVDCLRKHHQRQLDLDSFEQDRLLGDNSEAFKVAQVEVLNQALTASFGLIDFPVEIAYDEDGVPLTLRLMVSEVPGGPIHEFALERTADFELPLVNLQRLNRFLANPTDINNPQISFEGFNEKGDLILYRYLGNRGGIWSVGGETRRLLGAEDFLDRPSTSVDRFYATLIKALSIDDRYNVRLSADRNLVEIDGLQFDIIYPEGVKDGRFSILDYIHKHNIRFRHTSFSGKTVELRFEGSNVMVRSPEMTDERPWADWAPQNLERFK